MKNNSTSEKGSAAGNNPLEQFVLLAKGTKGAGILELIKQVLEAPGVHVFGELLDIPNILELDNGPYANYFNTLNLFAYGTYRQYLDNRNKFIELTPVQKKKLQHLTIVTLATKMKCIPYSVLLQELDVNNVRDLEDLIIEAVYSDIIQGKLDQKNSQLEVDYAIGRDIRPEDIGAIVNTLQEWCDSCEAVLACIETQVIKANNEKNQRIKHRESIEQEIANIKKTLKTNTVENDETMNNESREALAQSGEKTKKPINKYKGIRGSNCVLNMSNGE
ncbi:UNVERIFIED_CONTAM: hypothetical protein PYX00_004534 [Menopon gallinae]|uniref:PCI domain-containing protein n=1 Tax=Menopon gallinae TaxID=328185 RepID=A0AAW2I5W1_9NEOP